MRPIERSALLDCPILLAIMDDNIAALKSLIESGRGGDINAVRFVGSSDTVTALSLAVQLERVEMIRILIAAGADMYAETQSEWLFFTRIDAVWSRVARNCSSEIVISMFIDAGMNLNVDDERGDTLCHIAAENENEKVLATLLAAGAPHSKANRERELPAHVAAKSQNVALLKLLIDAGADCDSPDSRGITPCHVAVSSFNPVGLELLLAANVRCDLPDIGGFSPCFRAVSRGDVGSVARLIAHGCNLNRLSYNDKRSMCFIAASNSDEKMLTLLIASGVDVNPPDVNGETPLTLAASSQNEKLLALMLDAGARLTRSETDRTLLHVAAQNPNELVVKCAIETKCDINARDLLGMTPCHYAARSGSAAGLRALLAAGAALDIDDERSHTVCHFAAMNSCADALGLLISLGVNVDAKNVDGETPAHIAAIHHRDINFMSLILAGADVNAANANGDLLFHCAARMIVPDVSELLLALLRRGANFRALDRSGRSALHGATTQATAMLFALGADIDALDKRGQTPLVHALACQIFKTARMLIAAGACVNIENSAFFAQLSDNLSFHDHSGLTAAVLQLAGGPSVGGSVDNLDAGAVDIDRFQLILLRLRAFEICTGLQALELPALVTCEILSKSFGALELIVKFHLVWSIVIAVKHFRDRKHAPKSGNAQTNCQFDFVK
jgi:ankyrin repeat protein